MAEKIYGLILACRINDRKKNENLEAELNLKIDELNNSMDKLEKMIFLNKNKVQNLITQVHEISGTDRYSQSLLKSLTQFYSNETIRRSRTARLSKARRIRKIVWFAYKPNNIIFVISS